jgi:hypothetical protein
MMGTVERIAVSLAAATAPFAIVLFVAPAVSNAVECGAGTVYDAPTDSCVAAPAPPPPPPPPPAWNGDITPYFSVGICAPIPFVSLCAGI